MKSNHNLWRPIVRYGGIIAAMFITWPGLAQATFNHESLWFVFWIFVQFGALVALSVFISHYGRFKNLH